MLIDRLTYQAAPRIRLDIWCLKGASLAEVVGLRWRWARSKRRRMIQARQRPGSCEGTVSVSWRVY